MVRFKDIIKEFSHLRYIYEMMNFSTPMGRERMLNTPFCNSQTALTIAYNDIKKVLNLPIAKIMTLLGHFRDISGTINRISSGVTLSEVELFEIKHFSLYVAKLSQIEGTNIEPLDDVFSILDPEGSGVANFYIFDSYSPSLAALRKGLNENPTEELFNEIAQLEEQIRAELSLKLKDYIDAIIEVFEAISYLDMVVAKGEITKKLSLTHPNFVGYGKGSFMGLFNPYLMSISEHYQSIDISFVAAPTLIIGANMSGKTMLLKSVALAQYMAQFGLFTPTQKADISLVDGVFMLIGDSQQESAGLSSYGGEIVALSSTINTIERGGRWLVLIDELARTTSPKEGAAIVDATTLLFKDRGVMSLITTHYNTLNGEVRTLRVKGFRENLHQKSITHNNLSQFIDYSLEEVDNCSANQTSEAIRIAEILNINATLLNKIKECIENKK